MRAARWCYGHGTRAVWVSSACKLLASSAIHSVAVANPQHAPYGRAAMQALTSLALLPMVQPKLRTAENIAQAAQFASTGNADVGLISLTSALTLTALGHYVAVPQSAYQPILQGAVALKGGSNRKGAAAFLRYLQSTRGRSAITARRPCTGAVRFAFHRPRIERDHATECRCQVKRAVTRIDVVRGCCASVHDHHRDIPRMERLCHAQVGHVGCVELRGRVSTAFAQDRCHTGANLVRASRARIHSIPAIKITTLNTNCHLVIGGDA